ncbi:MAG: SDR family oxidoreductase [Deltaproteobacteria bacterium]|nr:MAG: SDR family oxidoreductase [Deltaproteobacteria bacterium]
MKVLITGISGKIGRLVAQGLLHRGHTVIGMDRRKWPDADKGIEMFNVDIRKRAAEDVFRTRRPDAVIHMATVTHFSARAEERYRINLHGTRSVFEYCANYGVKQAIFVGRHTYYGAAPDTPIYQTEAAPPTAVSTFPELADLVAADLFAASALWRYPDLKTAVLRVCYTLGPSHHGTLASFLKGPRVPTVMGFDPLFQFMHEHDVVKAIALALESNIRGVFNVSGPQPMPLSMLIKVVGRTSIPIPEILYPHVMGRFGFPKLPTGAVTHIKFPVVVDSTLFREATGFKEDFDEGLTMEAFRYN